MIKQKQARNKKCKKCGKTLIWRLSLNEKGDGKTIEDIKRDFPKEYCDKCSGRNGR
jgi:hypothetical protein